MVGRQLVALKVTIHSPKEDYVSLPFLLTSQEGVIIVDTEMVSEENEPAPKASAEYSLCGQWTPSVPQCRSSHPGLSWETVDTCNYPFTYLFTLQLFTVCQVLF